MPDIANAPTAPEAPQILIVAQSGRLTYEAVIFAASLRAFAPEFSGKLIVAEPQAGSLWPGDPCIVDQAARTLLKDLGADIRPFQSHHFGAKYPNGNKAEALCCLDPDHPFLFFDTDTLITGAIDNLDIPFDRPSASMARENTWPEPQLYNAGYTQIWKALYDHFDVPFEPTLDLTQPDEHWERYLYFNAGWFFGRDPVEFHRRLVEIMTGIQSANLPELASQSLYPWLDQIALPLVIASLGGGRPGPKLAGLDGDMSWHWRALPLLYAKATPERLKAFETIVKQNKIKKVLKAYEPFKRMIYQNRGTRVRELFDQSNLPAREQAIRHKIKRAKLWMR